MSHQSTYPANKIKFSSKITGELITTQTFPKLYLQKPITSQELISKVNGVSVQKISNEYPLYLIKYGGASELRSKWRIPVPIVYPFFITCGGSMAEFSWALTKTTDNKYIFGGYTNSFPPSGRPILLIKVDDYGNVVWSKTYGGGGTEFIRTIKQDPNGGYILAGYSTSSSAGDLDLLVFHISENGSLDWARVIGTSARDELRGAYMTSDGGVIMAGYTWGFGNTTPQPIVVKLNSQLNIEFAYVYEFQYPTYIWDFIPVSQGQYLGVGRDVFDVEPWQTGIVIKINQDGELVWARRISDTDWINLLGCRQISNNEYVLAGYSYAFKITDADIFVTKMTEDGNLVKSVIIGGEGFDEVTRIELDSDKNIIGVGITTSYPLDYYQACIVKLDKDLTFEKFGYLDGVLYSGQFEEARDVCESFDGGYLFTGTTTRYGYGSTDMFLIKTNKDCLIDDCPIFRSATPDVVEVEPNITSLSPTVIDVKNYLTINTPNYVSYDVDVIRRVGCILRGWDVFMEEQH